MDNYFTNTLANIITKQIKEIKTGEDEHSFIADLFNEELVEVGHIQFIPAQNRICITATVSREEDKTYHIKQPKLEFLKFVFENANHKVKKAVRYYFLNSPDAQEQNRENHK